MDSREVKVEVDGSGENAGCVRGGAIE